MGEAPDDPDNTVIKMVGPEENYFLSRRADFPVNLAWRFRFRIDGAARLTLHLNEVEVDNKNQYYFIDIATPGTHTNSEFSYSVSGQEIPTHLKNFGTVSPGKWHLLEISRFEDTFEIWIDEIQYVKYQDPNPPPPSSVVQQGVSQLPQNSVIYVDQMSVCELHAPFEQFTPKASAISKSETPPQSDSASDSGNNELINREEYTLLVTVNIGLAEEEVNALIENMLNDEPVSKCPSVFIESIPTESLPTYFVYISASQGDPFWVSIHPTNAQAEPYAIVTGGGIPPNHNENIIVISQYNPDLGQPTSDEFEIQVVFPGCDIYKEIVAWP